MLEKIKIASPCRANWEQMAGDERVRHCADCDLDVYNFSAMTGPEVERLVRERDGRLCARFFQRADGTMLTQDCPVGLRALVQPILDAAIHGLPALTLNAQPTAPQIPTGSNESGLVLHVVDDNGKAMGGARVSILLENSKAAVTGKTDENGDLTVAYLQPGNYWLSAWHKNSGTAGAITIPPNTVVQRDVKLGDLLLVGMLEAIDSVNLKDISGHYEHS